MSSKCSLSVQTGFSLAYDRLCSIGGYRHDSNLSGIRTEMMIKQDNIQIARLKEIVKALRDPDTGCSWDKIQTHGSLKPECIEEAAEVICGINIFDETGNAGNLMEELGDLLLQVVMHSQIAEEEGLFCFEDVARTAADKMVRRHPHVFGAEEIAEEEIHKNWSRIKEKEKAGREWESEYLKLAFNEAKALIEQAKRRKGFSD